MSVSYLIAGSSTGKRSFCQSKAGQTDVVTSQVAKVTPEGCWRDLIKGKGKARKN